MIVRELVTLLGFKLDDSDRRKYNQGIDQTKGKQQSLTASFLKAQIIMGAAQKVIGSAFSFVRDSVIGATAETERYRVTLGTMIGDQEKANKIIHDLDYSPVSDFYGTANAIGGLQGMVTFGMQAEEASDILTRIGDIAQGNSEAFVSMSNNMGQVFAKGKADATDLKQFVMQGFDVVGEVAKQSGKSREEIQKAGVTYEQTSAALKALTSEGGKYSGMLSKQMNTLGGIIKQFESLKAATAEAIGTGVSKELKDLLKYILEIARAGQETFVGTFVSALKTVIHWIYQIIITFEILQYRIEDAGLTFEPLKQLAASFGRAVESAISGIFPFLVELGKLIAAAFGPIQAFASPIIEELGRIAGDVFTWLADLLRGIVPMVQNSTGFFGMLGETIEKLIRPALAVAAAIKGINLALGAYKTAAGIAKTASFLFSGDVNKIAAALTKMTGSRKVAKGIADTFGLLTGKLSVMKKASEGNRVALMMLDAQMLKSKIATLAHAAAVKISTLAQKTAAVATKAWSVVQGVLNAVMAANPIMLIVLGVAALIAGIILLVKNWDKVSASFGKAGKAIGGFFASAGGKIKSFASSIGEKAGRAFASMKEKAGEAARKLAGAFAERFPNIYALIVDVIEKVKQAFGKLVEIVKPVLEAVINVFKTVFSSAIDILKATGSGLFSVFKTVFISIANMGEAIFTAVCNIIKSVFNAIKNVVLSIANVFKTVFSSIWNVIKGVFSTIFNTVFDTLDGIIGIWRDGGSFFENLWESIKLIFTNAWNAILSIGKIIADAFISIWNSVKNVFVTIFQGIAGIFSTVWQGIVNIFSVYIDSLKKIFLSVITAFSTVWAKVKAGVVKIIAAFIGLWKAYINAIKAIFNGLISFFSGLWDGIVSVAKAIWNGLKSFFSYVIEGWIIIFNALGGFFSGLWDGIVNTAIAIWDTLKSWFSGLAEGIKETWNGIVGFFSGLWEAIKQGPAEAIEYIKNAFFGLFNSVQEKLLGFIGKIREGWDKVAGFFGGAVDGVVNFFTGGDDKLAKDAPTKVNDMILTPEGRFETNPNDYIMAMQDPTSLARSGQEPESMGKAIAELVKAVSGSVQAAAGMVVNAIRGIVFGTNNQYNIVNNPDNRAYSSNADNRADNRAYSSKADNRAYSENNPDNRAYSSNADNRAYNTKSTSASYSYGGNESNIYNTHSENGGLIGLFAILRDPLLEMVNMLARFLMVQQPQPAFAGVPSDSLMGSAMTQAAAQHYVYNNSSSSYSGNFTAPITVNVNAGGMTPEQAQSAVQRGVQDALKGAINSSRGNIPSPEARRH